ncbi:hypothetical protein GFM44_23030 [Rhizobium leguminosarum bv. viciae]|nr:hypothetical protein [Rhizobium leguminosarum bv. viciae]
MKGILKTLGSTAVAIWRGVSTAVGALFMLAGAAGKYMAQFFSIASGTWKPSLDAGADEQAPRFEGLSQDTELEELMDKMYGRRQEFRPEDAFEIEAQAVSMFSRLSPERRAAVIDRFDAEVKNWLEPLQSRELFKLSQSSIADIKGHLSGERSIPFVMPLERKKTVVQLDEERKNRDAKQARMDRKQTKAARVEARRTGQAIGVEAAPGQVIDIEPKVDLNERRLQAIENVKKRMEERRVGSGPAAAYRMPAQMQARFAGGGFGR